MGALFKLARHLDLLCQRIWWPSMTHDAKTYIAACPLCASGKSSRQHPAKLLHPLLVLRHPSLSGRDGGALSGACVSPPWDPQGYRLRPGSPVHILGVAELLCRFQGNGKSLIRLSPTVSQTERTNRTLKSTLRCTAACFPTAWSS